MEIRIRDGFVVTVDPAKLTAEMRERLMVHGLRQKIADAGAGKEPGPAKDAGLKVLENLLAGEWGAERGESGLGIARGLLVKARKELKNPPKAEAWRKQVSACKDLSACAAFAEKNLGKGMGPRLVAKVTALLAEQRSGF